MLKEISVRYADASAFGVCCVVWDWLFHRYCPHGVVLIETEVFGEWPTFGGAFSSCDIGSSGRMIPLRQLLAQ